MKVEFDEKLESCMVCNSREIRFLLSDFRGIDIYQCHCGMRFMNPQYSDDYLARYYTNQYFKEETGAWDRAMVEGQDFYLSLVEQAGAVPGTLLDIGCGTGYLLEAAQARGWTVTGYDVDPAVTVKVSQRLGVPVLNGDFLTMDAGGPYTLITLHQVLEHLKDPAAYLVRIRHLLAPDGYLFVAVPNIDSLSNRVKSRLESLGFRKKSIGKYYDTDHHICYYSPPVLSAFLERFGFETLRIRNCDAARPGRSSIRKLITRSLPDRLYDKSTFLVIARKR